MTDRTRSSSNRPRRAGDGGGRHTLYVNLALFGSVVIGVLLFVGALAANYWSDHFTEVAKVNGVSINQDQLVARAKVDAFRIDYQVRRIRDEVNAGRLDQATADQETSALQQSRQSVSTNAPERLIDAELQAQLAKQQGVDVTDAQIDQRLIDEATTTEQRHVFEITIQPELSSGATTPTPAQDAAAKAKADQALADLKGGKAFADVAKAVSKDAYAAAGGDTGWVRSDGGGLDTDLLAAVFKLGANSLTDVLKGTDGSYRIGKVTEIAPPSTDASFKQEISDAGISSDAYRAAVRADLVRKALGDKIVAGITDQPTDQRRVAEIFLSTSSYQAPGDQVKVRHILYTPGDKDPSAIAALPSNDPGWDTAKAKAQATYDALKGLTGDALSTKFAEIAKTDSKDTSSGADGGNLPYFTEGQVDPTFGAAIFQPGLKQNQLLPPVKSQYGWHVILYLERRPAPEARMNALTVRLAAGADFATVARAESEASDASKGGEMGWIAPYQIDAAKEKAIFAAPVGKIGDVYTASDGLYLFKVEETANRKPDGDQLTTLKSSAFQNWYAAQKLQADIKRDLTTAPAS
jgi:parvulin-like peptidyl-prolyl isomerase